MCEHTGQPIIFPLSNPTSRSEATPNDLLAWTQGRAVVGTGSPFPPVQRNGADFRIDQTNNAYVFPGIGLGSISVAAHRISDGMLMAAARALADASPSRLDRKANLLPPVTQLRDVSLQVAIAVARQAQLEGLAQKSGVAELYARVRAKMWSPVYRPYRRIPM
jgi:malate dehydrogenase (oxaloacetate-decarboxylating)